MLIDHIRHYIAVIETIFQQKLNSQNKNYKHNRQTWTPAKALCVTRNVYQPVFNEQSRKVQLSNNRA